ncbi:MAG: hypothetical protein J4F50_12495 [Acidimicrobiia bacterium]|nr:hypothetical protein [Acidimicrobiia bacterium]
MATGFAGGTVVLAKRFEPDGLVTIMRRHRSTHLLLVPAAMEALLGCDSLTPEDLEAEAACDATSLERWCRQRLAAYKRPREWIFVENLPRTSLGKVKKHELSVPLAPEQQAG